MYMYDYLLSHTHAVNMRHPKVRQPPKLLYGSTCIGMTSAEIYVVSHLSSINWVVNIPVPPWNISTKFWHQINPSSLPIL